MDLGYLPITNSTFESDSKLLKDNSISAVPFLNVIGGYDRTMPGDPGPMWALDVTNCRFKDSNSNGIYAWDNNNKNNEFHLSGISAFSVDNVNIIGDDDDLTKEFDNVRSGINTIWCKRVSISDNAFENCDAGVKDDDASVYLCNNYFKTVAIGTALSSSKTDRTFENRYVETEAAFKLLGVPSQKFSDNTFNRYYNGIHITKSEAMLRPEETGVMLPGNIPEVAKYGRNLFTENNVNIIITTGDAGLQFSDNKHSDIFFWAEQQNEIELAVAMLQCGYNNMAEFSRKHLYSRFVKAGPNYSYNQFNNQNNEWESGSGQYFIRQYNVPASATPKNVSLPGDNACAVILEEKSCNPVNIVCNPNDVSTNIGDWATHPSSSTFLVNAFYTSRDEMLDVAIAPYCRRKKSYDAMQAAFLSDSVEYKINLLIQDYDLLVNEVTLPDANKISAILLKGEGFERLGELDSAKVVYNDLLANYPTCSDTLLASWRLQFIDAMQSDSTFGVVFDSSMAAYTNRVINDLRLKPDTSGGGAQKLALFDGKTEDELLNEIPDIDELAIKVNQNYPNPFFNLTEIQYFLSKGAWAKLTIRDINGKVIANLIDGYVKGSWHSLIINGSGLSNGAYVVVLEADGKAVTKLIQKIR